MTSPENFKFLSSYNQFYIDDGKNFKADENSYDFKEKDLANRLYSMKGETVVLTQTYGNVSGNIMFFKKEPKISNILKYDHIVEGNIEIKSGEIRILSWPGTLEKNFKVENGNYIIRILGSNFKSVIETDLQQDSDADFYEIQIWKSDVKGIKVIKQYPVNY